MQSLILRRAPGAVVGAAVGDDLLEEGGAVSVLRARKHHGPYTAYDMARDYGPLAFDIPHRLVTSFIDALPWGRGRRSTPAGLVGALASDWVVNGILSLNAGRPFTITATDRAGTLASPWAWEPLPQDTGAAGTY